MNISKHLIVGQKKRSDDFLVLFWMFLERPRLSLQNYIHFCASPCESSLYFFISSSLLAHLFNSYTI